ncbi:MAG TPA: leucine-rich repeat protein [Ruminococcus sp.]
MKIKKIIALAAALSVTAVGINIPYSGTAPTSITASAETSAESFEFDSATGTITKYNGSDTDIVIPSEINGVTVTQIKDMAFDECTEIISIYIPDSVTSIGSGAFNNCSKLEKVTLPNAIEIIPAGMFYHCSSLTDIQIPDSVTDIQMSSFEGCSSLTNIEIPDSVTGISNYSFMDCTVLSSVTLSDSLTYIGINAFANCPLLKSITIPKSVSAIDLLAFDSSITISGYKGSVAEEYAINYGIKFIALDDDEPKSLGDVNGDGIVNAVDASAILTYFAIMMTDQTPTMKFDKSVADYNNDGIINSIDASVILTYYANSMITK